MNETVRNLSLGLTTRTPFSSQLQDRNKKMTTNCQHCPLNGSKKVYAKRHKNALAVVGEAPGRSEEIEGEYFVGESGRILHRALTRLRIQDPYITNTLRCRAPQNLSDVDWDRAINCCKPRLKRELLESECTHILAVGKRSFHALTRHKGPVISSPPWIGSVVPATLIPDVDILPTVHPAFALRGNRQYLNIFGKHLLAAANLAHKKSNPHKWQPLHYYSTDEDATIQALENILGSKPKTLVGFDIETGGINPVVSPLTAISVATLKEAVSLRWPITDHFSTEQKAEAAEELLKRILSKKDLHKVAHNGIHDLIGLEKHGIVVDGYTHDTILLHHVIAPELPHNLGFVAHNELTCEPWKKYFKISGDVKGAKRFLTADPVELTEYNCKDSACLPQATIQLLKELKRINNGKTLYANLLKKSMISLEMQRAGCRIDLKAAVRHKRNLKRCIKTAEKPLKELVGSYDWSEVKIKGWNYKNRKDVNRLFKLLLPTRGNYFKYTNINNLILGHIVKTESNAHTVRAAQLLLDLRAAAKSAKADPQDADLVKTRDSLEQTLSDLVNKICEDYHPEKVFNPNSSAHVKALFFDILKIPPTRFSEKTGAPSLPATALKRLAMGNNPAAKEAARLLLRYRKYYKILASYIVKMLDKHVIDGYVHATPKVWGTKTGRWSYENPSLQVIPKSIKDLFASRYGDKGYILEADYSQLELRIIALLSGDKKLLQAYADGHDVHRLNMYDLFGKHNVENLPESVQDKLRTRAKNFVYGVNYGGSAETIWEILSLNWPSLRISDVQRMLDMWYLNHPWISQWQETQVRIARKHKYIECPLSGRRIPTHGDVDVNKCYNIPVQGTGADIIDGAVEDVHREIKEAGGHLIAQVHDALICDVRDPVESAKILQTYMARPIELNGQVCGFPIDFKVGKNWKHMIKCDTIEDVERAVETLEI